MRVGASMTDDDILGQLTRFVSTDAPGAQVGLDRALELLDLLGSQDIDARHFDVVVAAVDSALQAHAVAPSSNVSPWIARLQGAPPFIGCEYKQASGDLLRRPDRAPAVAPSLPRARACSCGASLNAQTMSLAGRRRWSDGSCRTSSCHAPPRRLTLSGSRARARSVIYALTDCWSVMMSQMIPAHAGQLCCGCCCCCWCCHRSLTPP